ncbi:MAG: hypothetical protein JW874_01250, partial [Spirochaetales bacterium]|nr:hypothetical protein [Spirochaetales bacterium]
FLKIHGSIFYDRTYFIPTLAGRDGFEDFSLFDANTVFGGEIVYEIVPTLDLALLVTTTVNDDNEAVPSIGIETRVHF